MNLFSHLTGWRLTFVCLAVSITLHLIPLASTGLFYALLWIKDNWNI
jgi:hypothetical protein